jgi:hypothetical protein
LDAEGAVLDARRDRGVLGASVFRDVGERLGHDESAVASTAAGSRPTDTSISTDTGIREATGGAGGTPS